MEWEQAGLTISDDKSKLCLDTVCRLLADTYWASRRSRDQIASSINGSLCFGVYEPSGEQIAFMRVVTDRATFAWVCDVIVDPAHRGRGIGKAMMRFLLGYPELAGVNMLLGTRDAHGLYEQFGFTRTEAMRRPAN